MTLPGSGTPPRHALYLAEAKIGLSPYEDGVRVAGVFELGAKSAEAWRDAGEKLRPQRVRTWAVGGPSRMQRSSRGRGCAR